MRSLMALSIVPALLTLAPSSVSRQRIGLSDEDRAAIVQSVLREVFNSRHNVEGEHFILTEGIKAERLPSIPKFKLTPMTRQQLKALEKPPYYYVVRLNPMASSVRVVVHLYDTSDERYPEMELYFSYRKTGGKWRGKYLYGAGA
jgi:hypothetical protein